MPGFVVRMAISAFGLWLAHALLSGIYIDGFGTLLLAALLLGAVNAVIRPIAVLLTLPFTVVTLGLFLLVVNAAMLGIVAWLIPGFAIAGFGSALMAAIIISFTSWIASWYIGPRGSFEVVVVRQ